MPEVVRKLPKKPEPEKVQEPVSVDVGPIAKALEMQGRLLADHQEPGSVGEALSAAGSAGDPWISTIEGTLSARDVFRVLLSIAAGNATGLASGSYEYKGQDGTTVRVAGTIAGDDRTVTTVDGA